MKDEIKEILDGFKEILDNPTTTDECYDGRIIEVDRSYDLYLDEIKALLDYITNLQKSQETLIKNDNEIITNLQESEAYYYGQYKDYKSRNDRAIEYNKQIIKYIKDFYRPTEDRIYSGDTLVDIAEQNINILGGDK